MAVAFLRPTRSKALPEEDQTIITAGAVEGFSPGTVTAFVRGRFYLARLEDGGFIALSRTCTHLGCTLPWSPNEMKFACPCHGSSFSITGEILDSPAPRALDIYPVTIENNMIKVDVGQPIQRSSFDREQVTYPKRSV